MIIVPILVRIIVLLGVILLFVFGLSGVWRMLRRTTMKTRARIGAALSFAFFLLAGVWLLILVASDPRDGAILVVVGFYLLGQAFYAGTKLWLAAEKCCTPQIGK